MRLFTALPLPPEILASLAALIDHLRPTAPRIKWSPQENLHITTRFIGEWPEPRLPELQAALAAIPSRPPLEIQIRNVGFFPNPHAPHSFWAGIHAADLPALAADLDRALQPLGLEPERRAFNPHLTLARIKDRPPIQPLREAIAALPSLDFGSFTAAGFFLYLSRLGSSGSVYTKLAEFPLQHP